MLPKSDKLYCNLLSLGCAFQMGWGWEWGVWKVLAQSKEEASCYISNRTIIVTTVASRLSSPCVVVVAFLCVGVFKAWAAHTHKCKVETKTSMESCSFIKYTMKWLTWPKTSQVSWTEKKKLLKNFRSFLISPLHFIFEKSRDLSSSDSFVFYQNSKKNLQLELQSLLHVIRSVLLYKVCHLIPITAKYRIHGQALLYRINMGCNFPLKMHQHLKTGVSWTFMISEWSEEIWIKKN